MMKWEVFSICSVDKSWQRALCAFSLSCFDIAPSVERILISLLIVTLQFAKDGAYVIDSGAHLTTNKQTEHS